MSKKSFCIIGAGAAGLSLGVMLKERGNNVLLFEKSPSPGGLCRSTVLNGFTWDQGPHILGGIPDAVEWIKKSTGVEFVEGATNSRAFLDGRYSPHPFERQEDVDLYMAKMWKTQPEDLDFAGLGAQKGRKPGGVSRFLYPKRGGYQSITDAWVRQLEGRIQCNTTVLKTFPKKGFDATIYTAPTKRLGQRYNTLVTVTACCWGYPPYFTALYMPYNTTRFHRLSFPAALSQFNAPAGGFVVQAEMTSPSREVNVEGLEEELRALLAKLPGCDISEIESITTQVIPNAYPVPLKTDIPPEDDGYIYHGRSGAHSYLNLDGVVDASLKLADQLCP